MSPIAKLLMFSAAMLTIPVGGFFSSKYFIFEGTSCLPSCVSFDRSNHMFRNAGVPGWFCWRSYFSSNPSPLYHSWLHLQCMGRGSDASSTHQKGLEISHLYWIPIFLILYMFTGVVKKSLAQVSHDNCPEMSSDLYCVRASMTELYVNCSESQNEYGDWLYPWKSTGTGFPKWFFSSSAVYASSGIMELTPITMSGSGWAVSGTVELFFRYFSTLTGYQKGRSYIKLATVSTNSWPSSSPFWEVGPVQNRELSSFQEFSILIIVSY